MGVSQCAAIDLNALLHESSVLAQLVRGVSKRVPAERHGGKDAAPVGRIFRCERKGVGVSSHGQEDKLSIRFDHLDTSAWLAVLV